MAKTTKGSSLRFIEKKAFRKNLVTNGGIGSQKLEPVFGLIVVDKIFYANRKNMTQGIVIE